MSYHEYTVSQWLASQDLPFYALIMAAMRKADTINSEKLHAMFPSVWHELQTRYESPGGLLPGEGAS